MNENASSPSSPSQARRETELARTESPAAEFKAPVLFEGEDPEAYGRLVDQLKAAVGPKDIIEELWVDDLAYHIWETMRLRRLRAQLLISSEPEGLKAMLQRLVPSHKAEQLVRGYYGGDVSMWVEVYTVLKKAGITLDAAVMAETLANKLDQVERIDRMIANADRCRNAVLREVDFYRAALGARLRAAGREVEDADFSEVPPGEAGAMAAE